MFLIIKNPPLFFCHVGKRGGFLVFIIYLKRIILDIIIDRTKTTYLFQEEDTSDNHCCHGNEARRPSGFRFLR